MAGALTTLGDASVGADDVALLTEPNWLNDNVISFWCEHLRLNVAAGDPRVLFILPNLAFFLRQCRDAADVAAVAGGLVRPAHELVVAAANNSGDDGSFAGSARASGTHWSVLVWERAHPDTFRAYDSLHPANAAVMRDLANKLHPLLLPPRAARAAPALVACDAPRQQNSYDCGAHACATMQFVVQEFLAGRRAPRAVPALCMQATRRAVRAAVATAGRA